MNHPIKLTTDYTDNTDGNRVLEISVKSVSSVVPSACELPNHEPLNLRRDKTP